MSEIYTRPIEIFAYSDQPMRTLHEQIEGQDGQSQQPMRLSYHGRSHYNAVVSLNWNKDARLVKKQPGDVEDEAIELSKHSYNQE